MSLDDWCWCYLSTQQNVDGEPCSLEKTTDQCREGGDVKGFDAIRCLFKVNKLSFNRICCFLDFNGSNIFSTSILCNSSDSFCVRHNGGTNWMEIFFSFPRGKWKYFPSYFWHCHLLSGQKNTRTPVHHLPIHLSIHPPTLEDEVKKGLFNFFSWYGYNLIESPFTRNNHLKKLFAFFP